MNDHFAPDLTPLGPQARGLIFADPLSARAYQCLLRARSNFLEVNPPDMVGSFDSNNFAAQEDLSEPQVRVPGHPGFLALLDKMRALHLAKDRDYSGQNEPFSNFRNANRIGVKASVGAYIRFQDKVARLENLLAMEAVGEQPSNESIEDNLMDVGAYALIILCLREEERVGHD